MESKNKIPSPEEFIINTPIYDSVSWSDDGLYQVIDILYFKGNYDIFCPSCGKESTFSVTSPERPGNFTRNKERERMRRGVGKRVELPKLENNVYRLSSNCARNYNHTQIFFILFQYDSPGPDNLFGNSKGSITKIGQHPSIGDLQYVELQKYKKVIDNELLREFKKAIGLASHGIGIGSYVYLRRIFEKLIEKAHIKAIESGSAWDDELYKSSKVIEKVKLLKDYLPTFLVSNPSIYSILSKGVHELTEEECLKSFGALKAGIEIILDQDLQEFEKEKKIKEAKNAINKAMGNISK